MQTKETTGVGEAMKDKNGRNMAEQNRRKPRWPTCVDETGDYIHFGAWKLIRYLGYFKKSPKHEGYHKYFAECLSCGLSYKMMQDSLVKSERRGLDKCRSKSCKGKDKNIKKRITKAGKQERMEKAFSEWVALMRDMRATPLEFRRGFDSERQPAMYPAMCICDPKR